MIKHLKMGKSLDGTKTHVKFANGARYTLEPEEDLIFNQYYITIVSSNGISTVYPHSSISCVSYGNKK